MKLGDKIYLIKLTFSKFTSFYGEPFCLIEFHFKQGRTATEGLTHRIWCNIIINDEIIFLNL